MARNPNCPSLSNPTQPHPTVRRSCQAVPGAARVHPCGAAGHAGQRAGGGADAAAGAERREHHALPGEGLGLGVKGLGFRVVPGGSGVVGLQWEQSLCVGGSWACCRRVLGGMRCSTGGPRPSACGRLLPCVLQPAAWPAAATYALALNPPLVELCPVSPTWRLQANQVVLLACAVNCGQVSCTRLPRPRCCCCRCCCCCSALPSLLAALPAAASGCALRHLHPSAARLSSRAPPLTAALSPAVPHCRARGTGRRSSCSLRSCTTCTRCCGRRPTQSRCALAKGHRRAQLCPPACLPACNPGRAVCWSQPACQHLCQRASRRLPSCVGTAQ